MIYFALKNPLNNLSRSFKRCDGQFSSAYPKQKYYPIIIIKLNINPLSSLILYSSSLSYFIILFYCLSPLSFIFLLSFIFCSCLGLFIIMSLLLGSLSLSLSLIII